MTTSRKPRAQKTAAKKARKKTTWGVATAKARRVARKAKGLVDVASHDAALAARRTKRKLEATIEEAKGPAKRRARKVQRNVVTALENAGASISTVIRRAKARLP